MTNTLNRKIGYFILGACILVSCLFNSCALTKPVKTGEMAYAVKQYAVAIDLLEEEYEQVESKEDRFRKADLLGRCYDILQNYPQSLRWYDIADQISNSTTSNDNLAFALKKNQRYDEASDLFLELYKKTKENKYRSEAEICKLAIVQLKNQDDFDIESFSINSPYSEYSPTFYEDDFLVFSSDRKGSTGNGTYKTTGNAFSDLYVMNKRGRQVHNFDATINSPANEGTVCFNKTFDEMFFSRCESKERQGQFCKLYYSRKFNGYWEEPEAVMFFDDKTNFFHPALIENDSVLIFSAAPNGSPTYDLYYAERVENGWTEAEIMPSTINTLGNEKFPTVYNDTLYFSSDGLIGYGGLDIFKTFLKSDGSWSKPENMGIPMNSGADDFGISVDPNFKPSGKLKLEGFLSSSRNYANNDDIFFFSIYNSKKKIDKTEEPIVTEEEQYTIYLAGRVVENVHENDDPNADIIDKIDVPKAYLDFSSQDSSFNISADNNGRFLIEMKQYGNFEIVTRKLSYLTEQTQLFVPAPSTLSSDTTINVEIALEKIIYDAEIIIPNIYYDYDKWDIRKDAEPALNELTTLLKLNPNLNIELGSHTDCRGEVDYNQDLSQKRAESVVQYLTSKAIDGQRLKAKGYGESNLKVTCLCDDCTEEEHQINRRTTFKIIK